MNVDDRKLCLGHSMLSDDERRCGAVIDDRWWRKIGRLTRPNAHERRAGRTFLACFDRDPAAATALLRNGSRTDQNRGE
jgi:hypothetical protein